MADLWVAIACGILIIGYSVTAYYLLWVAKKNFDEKRTKEIKKVATRFSLFPLAYFVQWLAYGLLKTHLIEPTFTNIIWVVTTANTGGMMNFLIYYPLLLNQVKKQKSKMEREKSRTNNASQHGSSQNYSHKHSHTGPLSPRSPSNNINNNNNYNNRQQARFGRPNITQRSVSVQHSRGASYQHNGDISGDFDHDTNGIKLVFGSRQISTGNDSDIDTNSIGNGSIDEKFKDNINSIGDGSSSKIISVKSYSPRIPSTTVSGINLSPPTKVSKIKHISTNSNNSNDSNNNGYVIAVGRGGEMELAHFQDSNSKGGGRQRDASNDGSQPKMETSATDSMTPTPLQPRDIDIVVDNDTGVDTDHVE